MEEVFFTSLSTAELGALIESSLCKVMANAALMVDTSDTMLESHEAAALIKFKISSLYGLVKRRKIPFCKLEGKLLFSRNELLAWIEKKKQKPA